MLVALVQPNSSAEVIAKLEEYLAMAKSGELKGFVIAADAAKTCTWCTAGVEDRWKLIGYIEVMKHILMMDDL